MGNLTYPELFEYISEKLIIPFYQLRLDRLQELRLNDVLKRKNPYLFKAKNITTAQDLVTEILQAHLSSQEETVFGNYLEDLAIFICSKVYGGFKSSAAGIDLEMDSHPDKGDYLKLCGQAFWSLISGDDDLYVRIIEPLGEEAKQKDEVFKDAYSKKVNLLTAQFLNEFCTDGNIDWHQLLRFVSSRH